MSADKPFVEDNQAEAKQLQVVKNESKVDSKIDYAALEQQRTEKLQAQLKNQLQSMEAGNNDSIRRVVLRYVVEGKYREASTIIDEYLEMKKGFPAVQERAGPHANHAKELINAVRAKRNFPNLSSLSMAKQQEILDHALSHFEELKQCLKSIEYLVRDEAIKDTRSTVWVVRTFSYAILAIVGTTFFMEFSGTLGQPLWVVFNDFADISYKILAKIIPFL